MRRRAVTLIELMVVMAVLSLVVTMIFFIVQAGMSFYLETNSALEIREQALVGLNKISVELRESSMASVGSDTTSVTNGGIVFGSARDANQQMKPTSDGKLQWQRYICYYTAPFETGFALLRKEDVINPPADRAPDPFKAGKTPAFFRTSAAPSRMVSRNVEAFNVTQAVDSVEIILSCQLRPGIDEGTGHHLNVIEVRTKVVPNLL